MTAYFEDQGHSAIPRLVEIAPYVVTDPCMQTPREILTELWTSVGGEPSALDAVTLTGEEPQLPSSFRVAAAAQVSIAAARIRYAMTKTFQRLGKTNGRFKHRRRQFHRRFRR